LLVSVEFQEKLKTTKKKEKEKEKEKSPIPEKVDYVALIKALENPIYKDVPIRWLFFFFAEFGSLYIHFRKTEEVHRIALGVLKSLIPETIGDFKLWMEPYLFDVTDHSFPHHFLFTKINTTTNFFSKNFANDPWTAIPGRIIKKRGT